MWRKNKQHEVIKKIRLFYQVHWVLPSYSMLKYSKNTIHVAFSVLEAQGIVKKLGSLWVVSDKSFFDDTPRDNR